MLISPATVVVVLLVGIMLIVGGVLLGASRARQGGPSCPKCGRANGTGAKYCGQCGAALL